MPYSVLEGIRVIEVANGMAGSFCAKLLADYGADVIKVERPASDDSTRDVGHTSDASRIEERALALHLNTNKRAVTLDLEYSAGADIFTGLVRESHVLIESYRPGSLDSLGLGYSALKTHRPELVMTSITPFGQTGPHKDYEFTELTIFAAGGAMYREAIPGREPVKYGGQAAQYFAGTAAAIVTIAASLQSYLSGQGQWIDISIQESMGGHPHQMGRRALFAYSGELDPRGDPHTPSAEGGGEHYAAGTFRCKDGYITFRPLGPRMWPSFARMIDKLELLDDPRYSSPDDRRERHRELEAIFQSWLNTHTREQAFTVAQEVGLPCAPVLTIDEVMVNEHFLARDYFTDIQHPDLGTLTYTGLPFGLSDAQLVDARAAPLLGQHNDEIFSGILGIEGEERMRLKESGVI